MSRSPGVRRVFDLLRDFMERVVNTPQFAFNGDITQMDVKDVNNRVKGIQNWVAWITGSDGIRNDRFRPRGGHETHSSRSTARLIELVDA